MLNRMFKGNERLLPVILQGVGFDNSAGVLKHMHNGGYGLYNVQQRVKGMGGSMDIDSAAGRGTVVTVTVPFLARE